MNRSRPRLERAELRLAWLVFVGGAAGSLARYVITSATPAAVGQPWAILAINVVGAFALGWLLEALLRWSGPAGRHYRARLLLGTGFLGGFTTYSALAVDSVLLLQQGPLVAVGYPVATLVLGAAGTVLGRRLGRRPGLPAR